MRTPLSRRRFIQSASAATAGWMTGPAVPFLACQGKTGSRPNILVIMSDEHNASVIGCYGNKLVRTPNLDALAAKGVVFESAYTNSPLCVPSRLAFTAGKYISRTSAWNNSCWLPSPNYPTLPRILNAAGYESFLCGKMHYDRTARYGFTEIGGNMNNDTKTGRGNRRNPADLREMGGYSKRFAEFGPGEGRQINHDRRVTAGAREFFSRRKKTDKPFFLFCGYVSPHFPLNVPEKYWDPYRGKVPMPVIPAGHLESLPLNYKHLRVGFNIEHVPADVVRESRELYYGLTQWLDEEIGRLLAALKENDLADHTVLIYTTDHGENLGEHGLWWKNSMYENSARVPLIISWPARWKGGQRRIQACSTVDVVKTIAEIGGAKIPNDWNGDSMVPWLDDPMAKWKDIAVSEYYAHNIASGLVMLRSGRYKYVYHTLPDDRHPAERELYDLKADPGEFNNLASRPEHKERVAQMHVTLVRELGESPDNTEQRCRAELAKGYQLDQGGRRKSGSKRINKAVAVRVQPQAISRIPAALS